MLRIIPFPWRRLPAPPFAVVIALMLLAACGGENPATPSSTVAPTATLAPALVPQTKAPPASEPTATAEPAMAEPTTAPAPEPTATAMPAETPKPRGGADGDTGAGTNGNPGSHRVRADSSANCHTRRAAGSL